MKNKFAKLYETEKFGQILVKIDHAPDGNEPEVRFHIMPPNLGVCSFALSWLDNDPSWDKAEKYFEEVNENKAIEMAQKIIDMFNDVVVKSD